MTKDEALGEIKGIESALRILAHKDKIESIQIGELCASCGDAALIGKYGVTIRVVFK
jgi:hypothetical protein